MSSLNSPFVQVRVDTIHLRVGQTLTVYIQDDTSNYTQVELRSVGAPGANVGKPEIFCDDGDVVPVSFDEWLPLDAQYRRLRGLPSDPKPPIREEE